MEYRSLAAEKSVEPVFSGVVTTTRDFFQSPPIDDDDLAATESDQPAVLQIADGLGHVRTVRPQHLRDVFLG